MKRRGQLLLIATALAITGCGNLKSDQMPDMVDLGVGTVTQKQETSARTGESNVGNAAVGLVTGGVIGAAVGAGFGEKGLGDAKLNEYVVQLARSGSATFQSFSNVDPGDCVSATQVRARQAVILERVDAGNCH